MNYYRIILFCFVLISSSCFINKSEKKRLVNQLIVPYEGVDNIKIGISGLKDINLLYENIQVSKYWEKWGDSDIPPFFIGQLNQKVEVKNIGITFHLKKNKRLNKRVVFSIVIDSLSSYKTNNGIGIGSTYEDIKKLYGFKEPYRGSSINGLLTGLVYYNNNTNACMNFIDFGIVDSSNFSVKQIIIR